MISQRTASFRLKLFAILLLGMALPVQAIAQIRGQNDTPQAVVQSLYKNYAWEVLFASANLTELIDQPDSELGRYFSPRLVAFLHKDQICRQKAGDACALDFDPIFASQDRGAIYGLEVRRVGGGVNDVIVLFHQNATSVVELTFKMTMTSDGWRIEDIQYGNNRASLAATFQSPDGQGAQ